MPQMAPLSWCLISLLPLSLIILNYMKIYFPTMMTPPPILPAPQSFTPQLMIWKW